MPRIMKRQVRRLAREIDKAVNFAQECEKMRIASAFRHRQYSAVHRTKIEDVYELAYLKMFISWEDFLEATFMRYLCGQCTRRYACARLQPGMTFSRTLADAELVMLNGQDYVLWGSTHRALNCVRRCCRRSRHGAIIGGLRGELDDYCRIRNRVAHGQPDCIRKFNAAVLSITGGTLHALRAGRFLRSWDTRAAPHIRWIESIAERLKQIAARVV